MLLELCYKALFNHITRRNHERQLNKRIIEKKQRVDAILMSMRAQEATEEQLADVSPASFNYGVMERFFFSD